MPALTINDIISGTSISDISGILVFSAVNDTGHEWKILDYEMENIYSISDTSLTNALYLSYSDLVSLSLDVGIGSPSTIDIVSFYLVPSGSTSTFTDQSYYNVDLIKDVLYQVNYFKIDGEFTITSRPTGFTTRPSLSSVSLSTYTAQEVNSAIRSESSSYRVTQPLINDVIASEVKTYSANNGGAMPQFKNYRDYLAYKNAINTQNYLLNRYSP